MLLNILQAIFGFLTGLVGIAGNTWDTTQPTLLRKMTNRGWTALVLAACTLVVTVIKEINSEKDAARQRAESAADRTKLILALDRVASLAGGTPQGIQDKERLAQALSAAQSKSPQNTVAAAVPPIGSSEPKWLSLARGEVGVKETSPLPGNPRIMTYLASTNLSGISLNDSIPWSAAFVNWALRESGVTTPNSASGARWETWGRQVARPQIGCVAIIRRSSAGRHIGFVAAYDATDVTLLSGNVHNQVMFHNVPVKGIDMYRCPEQPETGTPSTEAS